MSHAMLFINAAGAGLSFGLMCWHIAERRFGWGGMTAFGVIINILAIVLLLIKIAGERQ